MLDFKSVVLEDRELLTSFLWAGGRQDNNLSFANLCCWQFLTCSSYAIWQDRLVFRFCFPEDRMVYTLPGGESAGKEVIRLLARQAKKEDAPLYLYGIVPDMRLQLEKEFPDVFEYRTDRDHFDYLYLRTDLAGLRGKNFQAKRNHVNQFCKKYDFQYMSMTEDMIPGCLQMYDEWCEDRRCQEDKGLNYERQALVYGMQHFDQLGLTGGVIKVEGKIIAFTFGMPVNQNTFCIHAEKALVDYEGAYNVINHEFASRLSEQFKYLNREEDLGIPGLRKAKLSYRPVRLLEKGIAVCAEGTWDKLL